MAFDEHHNLARSTVQNAPGLAGLSITVAAGEGTWFDPAPFNATVGPPNVALDVSNAEIVRVTAVVGDVLTVTRAQESTTAKAIAAGWVIGATVTAKALTDIEAATGGGTVPTGTGFTHITAGVQDAASKLVEIADVAASLKPSGTAAAGDEALRALGATGSTAAAGNDARLSDSRPPNGAAGGVLDGNYPSPGLAASVAGAGLAETADVLSVNVDNSTLEIDTDALRVKALGITDAQVAAANKDGTAATASMRTLGTGATQAAAGNDARLSDSRPPNGSAGGDLTGSYPDPTLAAAGPGATGPIGSATVAPIITIDAKGRVTALSSASITTPAPTWIQIAKWGIG